MKKYFMSVAAMAGMMTLAACSSDDAVVNGGSNDVQTIQIAVASTGDRATRSRELNSEEPGQNIEKVKVVIRNKATHEVVYVGDINNWNTSTDVKDYTTDGHGRYATLKLEGADRLKKGEYTITAVGYTDGDFESNDVATATKGNILENNFTATIKNGKAEEIFAGESSISLLAEHAAINTSVTLHRQVAGYYGYFTSIPVQIDGKNVTNVRLVARSKNTKLEFGKFNSSFTDAANSTAMYVVNGSASAAADVKFKGSTSNDAFVLYNIKVSDWFKDGDTNKDGILDEKDTGWENALEDQGYQTYQKGTIFAGGFAVPFAATTDKTLELQLLDADGNILKALPVTMATTQKTGTVLSDNSTTTESPSAFSFFRNHMYTIGKKLKNVGTTPDPDVTPDEPEPLDKTQNIVIRVNDNWEVINHLELGE